MKFILIADNDKTPSAFFPLWQVILLVVTILILFYLLYPRHLLEKTLAANQSSPAVLNYLQAYKVMYPDNAQINLNVVEQEINLGLFKQARENLALIKNNPRLHRADTANQLAWMDYLILRYKAYHSKPTTSQHITYLQQLRQKTNQMAALSLPPQQLRILAQDSLVVAQAATALKIYNHLFAIHALMTPEDLATGGSIAMQNNAHKDSAKFYDAAYQASDTLAQKKHYAFEVIKVLRAGNHLQEALTYAQKLPESMLYDRHTLYYLSQLAIAANRPDIAEDYALKALLIKANPHE